MARIGFGVMQLERHAPDREAALAILTAAVDAGIDHFDTAAFYGDCNELIRQALGARRDGIVLATKVGAARNAAGDLVPGQKPEELRRQVEDNLASLGTDHLEVVNLRRLDHAPGLRAEDDQIVDIDLQLAELGALRDAGTVGAIGLSNVSVQQLEHALPAGIACVQNLYNLLERDSAPVLETCRQNDIAWVPYFPLGSAMPGREKVTDDPTVRTVAAELGATPAQVGLAWLLAEYEHTLLITGTSDPAHLAENIAAGDLRLPPEALKALNRIAAGLKRGAGQASTRHFMPQSARLSRQRRTRPAPRRAKARARNHQTGGVERWLMRRRGPRDDRARRARRRSHAVGRLRRRRSRTQGADRRWWHPPNGAADQRELLRDALAPRPGTERHLMRRLRQPPRDRRPRQGARG